MGVVSSRNKQMSSERRLSAVGNPEELEEKHVWGLSWHPSGAEQRQGEEEELDNIKKETWKAPVGCYTCSEADSWHGRVQHSVFCHVDRVTILQSSTDFCCHLKRDITLQVHYIKSNQRFAWDTFPTSKVKRYRRKKYKKDKFRSQEAI